MADRSTASLFAEIFKMCLDLPPGPERVQFVSRLLAMTSQYDFTFSQMNADESLKQLGFNILRVDIVV